MGQQALNGQPARYHASPPTRAEGSAGSLEVDINGNLRIAGTITLGEIEVKNDTGNPVPTTESRPTTAAVTSVDDQATSTTLIASNASARERIIQNDSASILYVKFGTTATVTDYTVKLAQDDILNTEYTGRIDGIWSANSTGAAKITELT